MTPNITQRAHNALNRIYTAPIDTLNTQTHKTQCNTQHATQHTQRTTHMIVHTPHTTLCCLNSLFTAVTTYSTHTSHRENTHSTHAHTPHTLYTQLTYNTNIIRNTHHTTLTEWGLANFTSEYDTLGILVLLFTTGEFYPFRDDHNSTCTHVNWWCDHVIIRIMYSVQLGWKYQYQ